MSTAAQSLRVRALEHVTATSALPHPGAGHTLDRWRALAAIAAEDVALVKVLEAHHDARSILHELGAAPAPAGTLWAVWAAEPPQHVLLYDGDATRGVVSGSKAWCSGADIVTDALVTARHGDARVLVHVSLRDGGHGKPATTWPAVGMARVVSAPLAFDRAPVTLVGSAGRYIDRPGFWHGGAGIAACWYGAACAIADTLRNSPRVASNAHAAAHLGAVHFSLLSCRALLRELAAQIDLEPNLPHIDAVNAARCAIERTCTDVIDRVSRALGPGPLCDDAAHAQRCADLAVFIRQCHAERDWQQLGEAVAEADAPWLL